ncbi:hypothetical protein NAC44_09775 [Allorhizobium sp. BGMRC 0089]|nr:hypothetical protein [Allorhizobium sonneratiae]MCM2292613.1 hypothetical protein [Allorhizobium sonneratiae]
MTRISANRSAASELPSSAQATSVLSAFSVLATASAVDDVGSTRRNFGSASRTNAALPSAKPLPPPSSAVSFAAPRRTRSCPGAAKSGIPSIGSTAGSLATV